jgi:hypothetical protein
MLRSTTPNDGLPPKHPNKKKVNNAETVPTIPAVQPAATPPPSGTYIKWLPILIPNKELPYRHIPGDWVIQDSDATRAMSLAFTTQEENIAQLQAALNSMLEQKKRDDAEILRLRKQNKDQETALAKLNVKNSTLTTTVSEKELELQLLRTHEQTVKDQQFFNIPFATNGLTTSPELSAYHTDHTDFSAPFLALSHSPAFGPTNPATLFSPSLKRSASTPTEHLHTTTTAAANPLPATSKRTRTLGGPQ